MSTPSAPRSVAEARWSYTTSKPIRSSWRIWPPGAPTSRSECLRSRGGSALAQGLRGETSRSPDARFAANDVAFTADRGPCDATDRGRGPPLPAGGRHGLPCRPRRGGGSGPAAARLAPALVRVAKAHSPARRAPPRDRDGPARLRVERHRLDGVREGEHGRRRGRRARAARDRSGAHRGARLGWMDRLSAGPAPPRARASAGGNGGADPLESGVGAQPALGVAASPHAHPRLPAWPAAG